MPGMDGVEVARKIKAELHLSAIPIIIMVTAYNREDILKRAEQVGLNGFLIKPVNASVLFDTIMEIMGQRVSKRMRLPGPSKEYTIFQERIRGSRVLVVEDNEVNRQIATDLLRSFGVEPKTASSGHEALELVSREAFDALLMDVQMPDMDGYQTTRHVREQNLDLPIIAVTAHSMVGDREKCLDAGMNDYVAKPVDPDKLLAVLAKWIKPALRPWPVEIDVREDHPAPISLPENLPWLDIQTVLKRYNYHYEDYFNLLRLFLNNHSIIGAKIIESLRQGDIEQSEKLVHSLKGTAGAIMAKEVHAAAIELEMAIKTGQKERYGELSAGVEKSLQPVLDSIKLILNQAESVGEEESEPKNIPAIRALLSELKYKIKESDLIDSEMLMPLNSAFPGEKALIHDLEAFIVNFDYDRASIILQKFAQLVDENGKGDTA
jgi:CheY-like chemotaxis protein/HPt (histidine-containing phosphotransfer) domain-containing protein